MSYGQGGGRGYGRRGGYGSFGPRNFSPKPVKAGEEYDVEITEISRRGDGIAKIQGFIIFVAGAKAGQKARVRLQTLRIVTLLLRSFPLQLQKMLPTLRPKGLSKELS